jgi:DNA-directed RNA polymerase specialized sigma24 family protein
MDRSPGSLPLAAGIEQEVADLYEREAGGILRYAAALANNRETAHDALQEAFFRFFLCRSAGQRIRSPKSWLFRVARNYVLDQKKRSFRNEVGMESLTQRAVSGRSRRKPMVSNYCRGSRKSVSRPGR